MIKLYDMHESGNCYKIRLFLSILQLEYESIPVDLKKNEHKSYSFLSLNPRGEIPVLIDQSLIVWDSQAILVYLAKKYADKLWLPDIADNLASVMQWLSVAGEELFSGLAGARGILKFGRPGNLAECQTLATKTLEIIDNQLNKQAWIAGSQVSIADLACYPYIALADQAQVNTDKYLAIQRWFRQIEALPGYISMPGIKQQNQ